MNFESGLHLPWQGQTKNDFEDLIWPLGQMIPNPDICNYTSVQLRGIHSFQIDAFTISPTVLKVMVTTLAMTY